MGNGISKLVAAVVRYPVNFIEDVAKDIQTLNEQEKHERALRGATLGTSEEELEEFRLFQQAKQRSAARMSK